MITLANPEILDRIPETGPVHIILGPGIGDSDIIRAWIANRGWKVLDTEARKFLLSITEWPLWFSDPGSTPADFARRHPDIVAAHYLADFEADTRTIRLRPILVSQSTPMTDIEKQSFISTAVALAQIERLEEGEGCVATVPGLPGVIAHAETESEAADELRSVLAGWLELGEQQGHAIPTLDPRS